jgi:hypothetical protein
MGFLGDATAPFSCQEPRRVRENSITQEVGAQHRNGQRRRGGHWHCYTSLGVTSSRQRHASVIPIARSSSSVAYRCPRQPMWPG